MKQLGQALRWARCLLRQAWQKLWPQAVTKGSASKLIHMGHCKSPSVKPIPWLSPALVVSLRPFAGSRALCSILMARMCSRTLLWGHWQQRGIEGGICLRICRSQTSRPSIVNRVCRPMAWLRACPNTTSILTSCAGRAWLTWEHADVMLKSS